jgi:hypothetical protein
LKSSNMFGNLCSLLFLRPVAQLILDFESLV